MSCFSACERDRKSCEYFLFEPKGASLNRVDWFESCSSFVKQTHIYATPPSIHTHTGFLVHKNVDFSFCCGGKGDRDEKEEAQ